MKLSLRAKEIPKESTVIVGVSGGRDSLALVHALLAQRKDLNLIAAHVNHGLRADSDKDAEFVKGMMTRFEVPLETLKPHKPPSSNVEEWGRNKRYEFFEKLLKKHKAFAILTAHHQDDDFESMMLHFLRGTRVKGLSGMAFQRGNLMRPLLFTPRNEINEYIEKNAIPYFEDPSNQDERYARNFLRHKIIPVLNHVYPGLAERWQKQKEYWFELQDMLETNAESFLDENLDKSGLDRKAYSSLPFPIRATVLEIWFRETTSQMVPDSATIERWDHAILSFPSRKKTEWADKKFLEMTKERAKISNK
ncbi:tRNA lysidine(34) synthetase TilS [Patescibacteria group bacterium]|nr:tRNA lysidine(34) synthetase TilS [Patescibacteria group bacterium]